MARGLPALVLAALALALLAVAPILAHAETVQLSAGMNTTVELRTGVNYTVQSPMVILFSHPVNITIYTSGGAVTLSNAMNVTLEPGVRMSTAANVTAITLPAEEETRLSSYTTLASACIMAGNPRHVARLSVNGPAKVVVSFQRKNDYYLRYYIVTLDDDPATWNPIWYRNPKRSRKPPTLDFGVVFSGKSVEVSIPAGRHTVYAAVSTFFSNGWQICINVVGDNSGSHSNDNGDGHNDNGGGGPGRPVLDTPPPVKYDSNRDSNNVAGRNINVKTIAIAAGAGILVLLLIAFLATRK